MSYQTYTTEALVCGSFASGPADKTYLLFTRDAGMVFASARSVREERSRQRYALQDFSHVVVSLVKGKGGWRIGSVEVQKNLYTILETREARGMLVRYVKQLRRYISGEVPDQTLYAEAMQCIAAIVTIPPVMLASYESVAYARLLTRLGYIAPPPALQELLFADERSHVDIGSDELASLSQLITQAEEVSHL